MSVTLEGNPGCSALGHLYRADGERRVCITCGYIEPPATTPADSDDAGPSDAPSED
jgi:hypothetical protein